MCLALFINSRISNFDTKRQHRLDCLVPILKQDHDFLDADSWVKFTEAFEIEHSRFTDWRSGLLPAEIERVLEGVRKCRVIAQGHKNRILGSP